MAASPYKPNQTPTSGRIASVNMEYLPPSSGSHASHHEDGGEGEGGLDMDLMHNFGEGVGVDMRDYEALGVTGEGDPDMLDMKTGAPLATPPQLGSHMHHPPTSATSNGHSVHSVKDQPPSSDMDDMFHAETGLDGDDEDDDGDDTEATPGGKRARHADVPGGFTYSERDGEQGRRKIRIEYIADKSRRHITFSKRKAGIMKKAYELSILTGTQVLLLVVSETGLVYTFTTTKLQPLVQNQEGKNLIQACLNAPDGYGPDGEPFSGPVTATNNKRGGLAIRPHKLTPSATAALAASAQAAQQASGDDGPPHVPEHMGHGTPVSARPKKRLPSGKGKKAQMERGDEMIPPVPPLELHRQTSPGGHPGLMPALTSPLSAGYHIPPEYGHPQTSPTNASFGYSTQGGPHGDYGAQGYYTSPSQGHPGYMGVPSPAHMYDAQQRERARMMMEGQGTMGMGM